MAKIRDIIATQFVPEEGYTLEGMKDLKEIVEKVKQVDDGVNNLIVPLLKDTISDSDRHNERLSNSNRTLAIVILVISVLSMALFVYQNNRYAEILSKYDFGDTVYQSTSDDSNINSGINITKYK